MDREKLVICLLIFIGIILFFTKEEMNQNLDRYDGTLPHLEQQIHTMHLENMSLKEELLEKESYMQINEKAKVSGFIPAPFITP